MSEMFGTAGGFRQYAFDQAELARLGQARQAQQMQMEEAQAAMQLRRAQAAQVEAETAALENRRQLMQAAMGAIATGETTPTGGPGDQLVGQLGQLSAGVDALIASGDAEGASKLLRELSQTRSSLATAGAQDELAERRRVQSELDKLRVVRETLSRVRGPADFEAAKLFLQSNPITGGDELPPELQQYNPAAIQAIVAGSAEQERLLQSDRAERNLRDQISNRAAGQAEQRKRTGIMAARAEAYIKRAERVAPAGGDLKVPNPREADIKAISARLEGYGFTDDQRRKVADYLAREALEQVARLPNLTFNSAADKVLKEAIDRGDLKKADEPWFGRNKPAEFAPGGSMSSPIAVSRDMPIKEGAFYTDETGETFVMRNRRLVPAGARPRTAPAPTMSPFAEEEDEE